MTMERQLDIFAVNKYHNSVPLRDEPTLEGYEKKAKTQDERILEFMKQHKHESFTPCQVHLIFGQCWPITSVRRSLTNLTKDGHLLMTGQLRPGLYGHPNNCWKYNDSNSTTNDTNINRKKGPDPLRDPVRT